MSQYEHKEDSGIGTTLGNLSSEYRERVDMLLSEYDTELHSRLIQVSKDMAQALHERNETFASLSGSDIKELTTELEADGKDAIEFITEYEETALESLKPKVKAALDESYTEAQETKTAYERTLEAAERRSSLEQRKEAGVFILEMDEVVYLLPTILFEDIEANPSLMLNLLEYCMATSESAGFKISLPEETDGYVRISAEKSKLDRDEIRRELSDRLRTGNPRWPDEANLSFVVVSDIDYPLLETSPTTEPIPELATRLNEKIYTQAEAFSQGDVLKYLFPGAEKDERGKYPKEVMADFRKLVKGAGVTYIDGKIKTHTGARKAKIYLREDVMKMQTFKGDE
ncbi:MAG: hypothetical protein ISS36_02535 [Candidatus Aenigmarchaeota archaeon]|nr:hypothetical protein [Candidatus Aenigmarchaeota archaeon]